MGKYADEKLNQKHTLKHNLNKVKLDYIGTIVGIVFFLFVCIASIPIFTNSSEQEISDAQKSVYREFTFVAYSHGGSRKGNKEGRIYVKEEKEPILLEYTAFFNKFVLNSLEEGMKIKCRVVKMPDNLKYSYEVVEFATEEKVFFTIDDYIDTSQRVANNMIGMSCAVFGTVTVIYAVLAFRYRKKYLEIKVEMDKS